MKVKTELVPILEEILFEFQTSKPEICLIPSKNESCAKDGGMIRVATISNPQWYRRMCSCFPRSGSGGRKKNPRTIVKRKGTEKNIKLLIKNLKSSSKYAPYIISEAQYRLELYQRVGDIKPFKDQF